MSEAGDGEVSRALAGFLEAFANLDWDAFRAAFDNDASVFFPLADDPLRTEGWDEIERRFRDVFEHARVSTSGPPYLDLRPRDLVIRRLGDAAVATFHLFDPGVLCRRTLVWHQTPYGWKIAHLHASNVPRPARR